MTPSAADGHPYQLVAAALASKIRRGELATDERLPSLRKLAKEHGVTVTTVQRAVQQLAQDGFVRSVPNLGNFVLPLDQAAPAPLNVDDVSRRVDELQAALTALDVRVQSLEASAPD
jgi:DNA-binding transcriptional regulator YhcF (GntR family)